MAQSILYYPTINIQNQSWLKSAILYWDEVCSIVPYDGYDDFSTDIEFLKTQQLYRQISPDVIFESYVANEFAHEIKRKMERKSKQLERQGQRIKCEELGARRDGGLFDLIHRNKIPAYLIEKMESRGFVRVNEKKQWLEMSKEFSEIYMKTLAEYIAKIDTHDIVIGTDRISKLDEMFSRTSPSPRNEVLAISLVNCLPVPREDVSLEDLIDFKSKRKQELYALREKIRELENSINKSESYREFKQITNEFKESWEGKLKETEKMFQGNGIDVVYSHLKAFVSGAAEVGGFCQIMNRDMDPKKLMTIAVGGGFINMGIEHRSYRNKIKENKSDQSFAYIIGAQRNGLLNID